MTQWSADQMRGVSFVNQASDGQETEAQMRIDRRRFLVGAAAYAGAPAVTDQMWIDWARVHFRGAVIVGKDLL